MSGQCCAIVFPGQGAQSFDMLAGYAAHLQVADTLREASDVIGCDFIKMIDDKNAALNDTINTQPVMLAMGVGVFRAAGMTKSGNDNAGMTSILPAAGANVMAGHSLGEYTALVCAGSLDFAEAVKLVRKRGEVMQNAGGAMAAAVGIDGDSADAICAKLREQNFKVWAANYNSPQQTVIAGSAEDLARAEESFKNGGAKRFVRLQMSCASHCPLMQNAAAMMAEEFDMLTITKYSPLVLHNVSAAAAKDTDDMLQLLRRHLTEPVRWVDTVRAIVKAGIHIIYECGPGKVLTNLNKRIAADIEHIALASSADL